MNIKNLIAILIILFSQQLFSQSDTSSIHPDKLIKNSNFFGFQIEAVSLILINELGISGDFDFYSSMNKKYNLGFRISTEYYKIIDLNFGGGSTYGTYWDFSILARHSHRGKYFWFSPLLGISLHNDLEKEKLNTKFLIKWGLELKYNLYKENVGLVIKFVSGFVKYSSYGGIGFTIGFYNN